MANFEEGGFPTVRYEIWSHRWISAADDWARGELIWLECYNKWHYPYMCGMCKRGKICGINILHCKNCKVAHYCSREHQEEAWPIHKGICKHLKSFFANYDPKRNPIKDVDEWRSYIVQNMGMLRRLGYPNDPLQNQMNIDEWMFQRHCQVCFFNPADIASSIADTGNSENHTLVECSSCHCAAHCSSASCAESFHKIHTPEACEKYFLGFVASIMPMQQGHILAINTNTRESVLGLPADWNEYFTRKMSDFSVDAEQLRMPHVMGMVTDSLSLSHTILRGLLLSYGATALAAMTRIEIHVLGAEAMETKDGGIKYEEVLHWLPNCQELVVCIVSGQLQFEDQIRANCNPQVCLGCKSANAKLIIRPYFGLYHDVIASNGNDLSLNSVTLVIACHSGIHDSGTPGKPSYFNTTWQPTIRMLSKTAIPCVFTGFNAAEIVADSNFLKQWGMNLIVEGHLNPFRGLRPYPEIGEDNRFYYTNHSVVIARGSGT